MAAGTAAALGAEVVLLEKMDQPGRKLRITGKGRCNITNQAELKEFISHFGKQGRFLYQAFSRFFVDDLLQFLAQLGIKTVVERGGRIFPSGIDAGQVTERLIEWALQQGVQIRTKSAVSELIVENEKIKGVRLIGGEFLKADAVVLTTGGASYTGTGSTGDGFRLAASVGHRIVPIRPALVPLRTIEPKAAEMQGLSLRNVRATILENGKATTSAFGEMLFTHFGMSGPIILTLSGRVVDALREKKQVQISIDLKPALDEKKLDARLLRELDAHGKQQLDSMLKNLLPRKMIPICISDLHLDPTKHCSQISAVERHALLHWLKDLRFTIKESLPIEAAIITAGGVSLKEVDPRTLESQMVKGLYFAGEVLDLNADTGGYNLQAAFSTGWMAGQAAARSTLSA